MQIVFVREQREKKNEEEEGCDGWGLKGRDEMRRSIETCLNTAACVTGLTEFRLLRR